MVVVVMLLLLYRRIIISGRQKSQRRCWSAIKEKAARPAIGEGEGGSGRETPAHRHPLAALPKLAESLPQEKERPGKARQKTKGG